MQGGSRDVAPEAAAAAAAFRNVEADVGAALRACASGRELIDAGYPGDVEIAAELDRSPSVPVLREGAFVGRRRQLRCRSCGTVARRRRRSSSTR
jgi:2-phosphosulfolactate phosphatase